jgi:hypothetical protein
MATRKSKRRPTNNTPQVKLRNPFWRASLQPRRTNAAERPDKKSHLHQSWIKVIAIPLQQNRKGEAELQRHHRFNPITRAVVSAKYGPATGQDVVMNSIDPKSKI